MYTPGRDRIDQPLSRRCINCSLRLRPNLRRRKIEELDEQMLIILRSWISPSTVSPDDMLCIECFVLLQEQMSANRTSFQVEISPALGHLSVCFGCGISIVNRRTHRVSQDCPQRAFILSWTPAHHIRHLERVCRACWEAATRNVQKQANYDNNRPLLEPMDADRIEVDNSNAVIPEPPPQPPANADLPFQEQYLPRTQPKIISHKYKRVSASSRYCLFNGCDNTERLLVPGTIKEVLLLQYNIPGVC